MDALVAKIESQLAALPVGVALRLPGGAVVGAASPAVTLVLRDWPALAAMAAGQIGRLAEHIVEGRIEVEGSMRDLMIKSGLAMPYSGEGQRRNWCADAPQ